MNEHNKMEQFYIDTNIFLNAILYDTEKNPEAKKHNNFYIN